MDDSAPRGHISSLRHMVRFAWPYRGRIALGAVALLCTSGAVLGMGGALRFLVDEGLSKGNPTLLDQGLVVFLLVTLAIAAGTFTRFYCFVSTGEFVIADIRNAIYRHLLTLDARFYETTRVGELLSRLTTDTTLLQNVVGVSVSIALRNGVMMLGGFVLLLFTSAKLSLYVLGMLPLVLVPILMLGRRVRQFSRASQDRVAEVSAQAEESINAIKHVQALTLEQRTTERFREHIRTVVSTGMGRIVSKASMAGVVIGMVFGAIAVVLWVGGHDVLAGRITPGDLSAFVFYAILVAGSVGALSEVAGDLQRAAGATERMMELLAVEPHIRAPIPCAPLPSPLHGNIHFRDITFYYPSRPDRAALSGVSLAIPAGKKIAVVGPSGAGKTTLFQLLLRFYDPTHGEIALDGVNIATLDPIALRRIIGVVPQDPVIFSASALENIRAGNPEASEDAVREAAKSAAALDFIEQLPEGLNSFLGEKGVRLSGGQRQRLAIARAIVRDPKILLLDEATSALDAENETLVQSALERLMHGRTTLVIAHRLATVLGADHIVVMEEGRIQAVGTHKELLEHSPLYARLAALQFDHEAHVA